MRPLVYLAVPIALLGTVCASEASDEEQIADVIARWQIAQARSDAEETCSYLTGRGKRLYIRFAEDFSSRDATSCEQAVGLYQHPAPDIPRIANDDYEQDVVTADEVRVNEEAGTASAASDYRGYMDLKREDGEWRIDVPGFFD